MLKWIKGFWMWCWSWWWVSLISSMWYLFSFVQNCCVTIHVSVIKKILKIFIFFTWKCILALFRYHLMPFLCSSDNILAIYRFNFMILWNIFHIGYIFIEFVKPKKKTKNINLKYLYKKNSKNLFMFIIVLLFMVFIDKGMCIVVID